MYAQYWGLTETPFKTTHDTRWFHESPGHEEALARLLFLVEERRRCGVLTGPAGTGKSLLLQVVFRRARRTQREAACIDLIGRSAHELLWETAAALGLAPGLSTPVRHLWRTLQDHLQVNQHASFESVLLFDHLDRAEADCTVALQRLFHLNSSAATSTTFVLATRNESLPRLAGFLNEISDLQIELVPLDRQQTEQYVEAQLERAGARETIFLPAACDRLHEFSRGIPRELNRICDLSLIAGMADGLSSIDECVVCGVAEELVQFNPGARGSLWSNRLTARISDFAANRPGQNLAGGSRCATTPG